LTPDTFANAVEANWNASKQQARQDDLGLFLTLPARRAASGGTVSSGSRIAPTMRDSARYDPETRALHLQFVQAAISRMAANSFLLKGWSITLTAAILALAAAKDRDPALVVVAILPGLAMWGLDAYFLRRERLFRCLYDDLRLPSVDSPEVLSMSTSPYSENAATWFRTLWTPAVFGLHGPLVGTVLAVIVLLTVFGARMPQSPTPAPTPVAIQNPPPTP